MPLAALVTFVTNPFTLAFWIVVANRVGSFVLRMDAATSGIAAEHLQSDMWQWTTQAFELAGVTIVGFLVLSIVTSAVGYLVASAVWRIMVARRRSKRLKTMEQRLDRRLGAK